MERKMTSKDPEAVLDDFVTAGLDRGDSPFDIACEAQSLGLDPDGTRTFAIARLVQTRRDRKAIAPAGGKP